ncbi:hypothetical protein OSTOST_22397 [Ostertagia ostertagi]
MEMLHLLRLVICAAVLTTTFTDIVHSSSHQKYCGKQITKALMAYGAVKWSELRESRCDEPILGATGAPLDLASDVDVSDRRSHHTLGNSRLSSLQKDLAKEMKVKDGLEKFMSSNTSASRRYLEDSKNMLANNIQQQRGFGNNFKFSGFPAVGS